MIRTKFAPPTEKSPAQIEVASWRTTAAGLTDEAGAAAYLGASRRTLRRWRKERTGPAYAVIGGRTWYLVVDLDSYVAECRFEPLAK